MAQAGHAYSQVDQPPGRIAIGRVERGQQPGGVCVRREQSHHRHRVDAPSSGECRADGEQLRPLFSGDERLGHGPNPHASEDARIRFSTEARNPRSGCVLWRESMKAQAIESVHARKRRSGIT
ncbi:hypothetical protein G6F40_015713 [Rhizopus arrhizus]|nr:hypothetical protein G6F40_015713 [Rhizopus arrhizus]